MGCSVIDIRGKSKEKLSKFESKYNKLKIFQQKPHIHFEILLIGFIFTIIFR